MLVLISGVVAKFYKPILSEFKNVILDVLFDVVELQYFFSGRNQSIRKMLQLGEKMSLFFPFHFEFVALLLLCRCPLWRTAKFSGCQANHCQEDSKCAGGSRGFCAVEHGCRHGGSQVSSPAPNQSFHSRHFSNSKLFPVTHTHAHTHTHTKIELTYMYLIDSLGV